MIDLFIFDLDNTLYDERLFFKTAYKKIAGYLSKKYNISAKEIYIRLFSLLEENDPTYPIFDKLFEIYKIPKQEEINLVLDIYYQSVDNIFPYEDCIECLNFLSKKYHLVLMTDGNPNLQTRKIKKLSIRDFFEKIIIVDEYYGRIHRKPSPVPFIDVIREFSVKPQNSIFIGDNIFKDFISPNRLKMRTIRVLKGVYAKYANNIVPYDMRPKITVNNLREILKYFKI